MRGRHVNLAELFRDVRGPRKSRLGRRVEWNFDGRRQP
jgi:hypothetical protein